MVFVVFEFLGARSAMEIGAGQQMLKILVAHMMYLGRPSAATHNMAAAATMWYFVVVFSEFTSACIWE